MFWLKEKDYETGAEVVDTYIFVWEVKVRLVNLREYGVSAFYKC